MTVASFDRAIAEANGYAIVTLPSGTVASVPKALATKAAAGDPSVLATTLGESTVGGNCGYSYIEFYARGGATADLRTGFGVIRGAISYWWRVDIIDTAGVSQQRWSGSLANRTTWVSDNGNFRRLYLTRGYAWAGVNTGSYAILNNGAVCYSGGPATSITVY
jgi:hypothetical protein